MPDYVSIAYRGASYALGQAPQYYGIWHASQLQAPALEQWPLTPEGWTAAWSRFTSVEVPGTIVQAVPAAPVPATVAPMTGPVGPAFPAPPVQAPAGPAFPPGPAPFPTGPEAFPAGSAAGQGSVPAGDAAQSGSFPAGDATQNGVPAGQAQAGFPAAPAGGPAASASFYSPSGAFAAPSFYAPAGGYPPAGPYAPYAPAWAGRQQWDAPKPDAPVPAGVSRMSAALVGAGLVLGLIGLFPGYLAGASLASQSYNLVPHLFYLLTWAVSGALILRGGLRLRAGALLGLGTSAVTLGLFIADIGTAVSAGPNVGGTGLWLSIAGWLACTAGVVWATAKAVGLRRGAWLARGRHWLGQDIVPAVTMVLAAIGAAIAFAPSWDRYVLQTATGESQTITAGNAFANPGLMIFGDVLVMVLFVAAIVIAVMWRPLRLGAALAAGAALPMLAQAISAIFQASQPASPEQFGVSAGEASQLGLTIHTGLTSVYWVFGAFLLTLILLCGWMLVAHGPAVAVAGQPANPAAAGFAAGTAAPGAQSATASFAADPARADEASGPVSSAAGGVFGAAAAGPEAAVAGPDPLPAGPDPLPADAPVNGSNGAAGPGGNGIAAPGSW